MFSNAAFFSRRTVGPAGAATALGACASMGWMTERKLSERAAVSTQRWASSRLLQTLRQQNQLQWKNRAATVVTPTPRTLTTASTKETATTTAAATKAAGAVPPASPTPPPPAADAAAAAPSKEAGGGFVKWYEGHLQSRPVPTKMVTGSLLWSAGDAVAQIVPHAAAGNPLPAYDWERTGRAAFFGFALHAPLSHLHFNFLEWMTVKAGFTGLSIPIFKTIMEQFVYWSWVSNSLYHGAMAFMQGMNAQQVYDRIADVLWDTQVAQWTFWIPVQLLNFQFVPVRHQLNVVLLTSIVWTALLSAWYPPEQDKEKSPQVQKKELIQRAATSHA